MKQSKEVRILANKSKEIKVRQIGDSPHFSKVSKVYVTNQSGGGDFDGTVDWESITNKPATFPSADHDHDDRYNTKEDVQDIVDYTREQMQAEQGKVMAHADDEPTYLESKVDNVTAVVEGNEIRSEEHTSELQSRGQLVCRRALEKKTT